MNTQVFAYNPSFLEPRTKPPRQATLPAAPALDEATIADLSQFEISQMPRDGLVQVIKAARLPQIGSASSVRLEFYDRHTLELLVYLARRCCRHRMTAAQSDQNAFPHVACQAAGLEG